MLNKEQQEKKFTEIYHKLNEQQRAAVDQLDGPVMVIAGPGTGKTQILSARIGKILLTTDASTENILCLTYTDAGAIAMRKRLLSFIGSEAYKISISTFHAFCNEVIQDNLYAFEKNTLDPISDLERIELMRKLIDAFDANHPLKRFKGEVYYDINNLTNLFSTMKREGWTSAFLTEKIDTYLEEITTEEEASPYYQKYRHKTNNRFGKKGEFKAAYKEIVTKLSKTKAAVKEFDNYQRMMHEAGLYDFDDMINWVIAAFSSNEDLLRLYQERYQYILVDEFQDTSGTQNKIVDLLIAFWDKPNVFVVGDDDQSIFRFQGANIENMESFADQFTESLKTVVLTKNYRSTQPILDASMRLIDNNKDRLIKKIDGLTKDLTASNVDRKHIAVQPQLFSYASPMHEMVGITDKIATLVNEGVSPGKIAVLYKENSYGTEIADFFKIKKIPYYSRRSENLLHIPFAVKIIQILRYVNMELDVPYGGDALLFEILHYDWFNIPPIEIAKVTVEVSSSKFKNNATSIRKEIYVKSNPVSKTLFDTTEDLVFKKASDAIEMLIAAVPNVTLLNLIEKLVEVTGIVNYIMQSEDKIRLLKILTAFFDFAKSYTKRNPLTTLHDFILTIDTMEKEKITIPVVEVTGNESSVNLLTAHGSKGLEFEYVFLANSISSLWEKKSKARRGFTLPENLYDTNDIAETEQAKTLEETRRLFYVAMTRAEKGLEISYPLKDNAGKDLEPSMFIQEIMQEEVIEKITPCVVNDELIANYQILYYLENKSPEIASVEEDFIKPLLEKFVMNATALNAYLDCPLKFYFNNLVRIPAVKNESMEFGSAVHFALQSLFEKMKKNNEVFPSADIFLSDFTWYLNRNRENFTAESYERALLYGEKILPAYYEKNINSWNKVVSVERNIKNVVVNGVPLKGKLDKLEFSGRDVNVVDYKTGKYKNAKSKLKAANVRAEKEADKLGGDYWRQAVFYKILVDNDAANNWHVISTQFDFVEPDEESVYHRDKIVISAEDIDIVKNQIADTWQKIQNKEFKKGCGKPDCSYCNFVKDNNLFVKLHNLNSEEEEI